MGRLARQVGQSMGILYEDGAQPRPGASNLSRYRRGFTVNPRLDQDIDELRDQVAELERRLAEIGEQ